MSERTTDPTSSAYAYPLLIKHLLHTPLTRSPGQEIVYRNLRRHDYRTFNQRIGRLADALSRLGVKPGETVAVMDWDSHRYLECYFAVPMMGAVLQTVNVRLAPDQILYTLNHAGASTLLVNSEFLPLLDAIRPQLGSVRTCVLLCDGDVPIPSGFAGEYEGLLGESAADYAFPDFDENTRATTFYTTGTTGLPKGVYFSHRQIVLHTLAALTGLNMAEGHGRFHAGDVYMPITPMFHVHAWGMPYMATLLGVKQVYPGRYAPDLLLELLAREKVTFSHCVPTILHMLLNHPKAAETDLRRWKVVIGGAAFPAGLAKAALERGIDAYAGYGMSETCPILTLSQLDAEGAKASPEEQLRLRTRTGRPVPLVDLRVVDGDGNDAAHDDRATGEVVVRAPWLTQSYLDNPQASEDLWRAGYLHTGDIGRMDVGGSLLITDRLKDVIKTGGEWVSSLEIENAISCHDGVAEVAVIGVKDACWGERPLALVVAKPGCTLAEADIIEHLQALVATGRLSRWAVPRHVYLVEQIDKTSVGKTNKRALREKYRAPDQPGSP